MLVERRFTTAAESPYAGLEFRTTTSEIRNPDGSVVALMEDIEVPAAWSQVACDIIAQKYFRKAGVAACLKTVEEEAVPSWLWAREPDLEALEALDEDQRYGAEKSATDVFDRLAGTDIPNITMRYLSMGMSMSWQTAIEEGANMVRVGTGIFGERS